MLETAFYCVQENQYTVSTWYAVNSKTFSAVLEHFCTVILVRVLPTRTGRLCNRTWY